MDGCEIVYWSFIHNGDGFLLSSHILFSDTYVCEIFLLFFHLVVVYLLKIQVDKNRNDSPKKISSHCALLFIEPIDDDSTFVLGGKSTA